MQVGLIGAGQWGRNYLQFSPDAVHDDPDGDPERLFDFVEPLDAVIVATPSPTHFAVAMTAIDHGCHVLVEKPMAMSAREAWLLERAARDRGTVLMVGHVALYSDAYRALKEFDIRPVAIYSIRHGGRERPEPESVVHSLAPHDFAMHLDLVGGAVRMVDKEYARDRAEIRLSTGTVSVSWNHGDPRRRSMGIVGERGYALLEGDTLMVQGHSHLYEEDFDPTSALRNEWEEFIGCCYSGARPLSDGIMGAQVVNLIEGAVS